MKKQVFFVVMGLVFTILGGSEVSADGVGIPVLYCTDLFHPHDDLDDHFDLASLYALPELDIKAIILDQGSRQQERPGSIPVKQMNHLTGRSIPYAIGLSEALRNPEDTGEQQPMCYQAGVRTILSILRGSSDPVTIISVGSVRDIAAAYNQAPELFEEKVARLYVFIGEAQAAFSEYNVELDVHAYQRIMNAPLPVYWVPCFDGGIWVNEGNASFWQARHEDLLAHVSKPVFNFFLYAMLQRRAEDPIAALFEEPAPEEKTHVLSEVRNLWCCAVFPYIAERRYVLREGRYRAVPPSFTRPDDTAVEPFSFVPVHMHVDNQGRERYNGGEALGTIHRFQINDEYPYAEVMTSVAEGLLLELSGDGDDEHTRYLHGPDIDIHAR